MASQIQSGLLIDKGWTVTRQLLIIRPRTQRSFTWSPCSRTLVIEYTTTFLLSVVRFAI